MPRRISEKEQTRLDALRELRDLLPPGTEIRTLLRHVSRSGMSRAIDLYVVHDGELQCITWSASRAMAAPYSTKYEAIMVGGCGMDMGFHLVYSLSRTLYPDGFGCIGLHHADPYDRGRACPSNDHSNREHNDWHSDGGYALRHRWI